MTIHLLLVFSHTLVVCEAFIRKSHARHYLAEWCRRRTEKLLTQSDKEVIQEYFQKNTGESYAIETKNVKAKCSSPKPNQCL